MMNTEELALTCRDPVVQVHLISVALRDGA